MLRTSSFVASATEFSKLTSCLRGLAASLALVAAILYPAALHAAEQGPAPKGNSELPSGVPQYAKPMPPGVSIPKYINTVKIHVSVSALTSAVEGVWVRCRLKYKDANGNPISKHDMSSSGGPKYLPPGDFTGYFNYPLSHLYIEPINAELSVGATPREVECELWISIGAPSTLAGASPACDKYQHNLYCRAREGTELSNRVSMDVGPLRAHAQTLQMDKGLAFTGLGELIELAPADPQAGVVQAPKIQSRAKSKSGERKIKAKIKGVQVVQGTNLFDPSGKGQTAAVPTSGQYVGRFAVVSDPCGLEGKIGLARGGQTLTAATRGATMDISGGPPFVKVSGPAAGNPTALSGNGTAAGQSANVSASASFGTRNTLSIDYVMTLAGRCAANTANTAAAAGGGVNAVSYKFTGRQKR